MNMFARPAEAAGPEVTHSHGSTGGRVRAARELAKLTQAQLSDRVGFGDRQTLSAIENGERRLRPSELIRISKVLERPLEWFIDPFVVEGEAHFSWRVSRSVTDDALYAFEAKVGRLVGLLRHLKVALKGKSPLLIPTLRASEDSSFEEAWLWGEGIAKQLELGLIPSATLFEAIENKLDIPVIYIDTQENDSPQAVSGAMCRLFDLEAIVINRQEPLGRRNFDLAHELFHALTWDALKPLHREDPDEKPTGKRIKRIEQLADNFAAGLLMPRDSLEKLIPKEKFDDVYYLATIAGELQVSNGALAYRLFNARLVNTTTCDALRKFPAQKDEIQRPKRFSASFVSLLHDGIARGHVSSRKAAHALSLNLEELAGLLREHGKPVPFAV